MISFRSLLKEAFGNNYVYHGTDINSAKDIIKNGVDNEKSHLGYFGKGFYTTPDENLAKSNYADFADDGDEPGVVLKFSVSPDAKLLDLRKNDDFIKWRDAKYRGVNIRDLIHRPEFDKFMIELGIDGLYDNSFEGWVFYNPSVLKFVDYENFNDQKLTETTSTPTDVFYHGTSTDFSVPSSEKIFWITPDSNLATDYANASSSMRNGEPILMV